MFSGFSEKTAEFLWELSFNNERPWFLEHKQEYEEFLNTPLKALAEDTLALLRGANPDLTLHSHVCRIYRDARRLRGRGPYKERMWFTLRTDVPEPDGPVFWFEIARSEYSFGMGNWATPAFMEQFRKTIDANPAAFVRLADQIGRHPEFMLDGEKYKRPKGSYEPPVSEWYNRKQAGLSCRRDFGGDLFSPELPSVLAVEYGKMMPLFRYLLGVANSME